MNIIVFSDNRQISNLFADLEKTNKFSVTVYPSQSFMERIDTLPSCQVVYLDLQPFSQTERAKLLAFISASPIHWYGIIDPKDETDDIALLFHQGISDYISRRQLKNRLTPQRIKRITSYRDCKIPENLHENRQKIIIKKALDGWQDIQQEKEYTFIILFVRVENLLHLRNTYGYTFTDKLVNSYYDYLKNSLLQVNGRLWMMDASHALFLFPYQDSNSDPILTAYSFMLNAPLISGEYLKSPELLKCTMLMHMGNLIYYRNESAGRSLSSSLNFLFHAASSNVRPGRFYITDMLFNDIPEEISDLFVAADDFEGHEMKVFKEIHFTVN